jgi:DHA2 family multidrug resistance protein-like MFS transporter
VAVVHPDGLPTPQRWWAAVVPLLGSFMAALDSTIANVGLPTIAHDIHATPAASIWIINAYTITVVSCLLPLSALGELIGFRRVSQAGMAMFGLASLACALSPSLEWLTLARIFQGLGAAAIMGSSMALVRYIYPHRQLGMAIGITAMVVAVSSATGPALASLILGLGSWRWLFGVNVPVSVVTVILAVNLPFNPPSRAGLDWKAAALHASGLGLIVTGLGFLSAEGAGRAGLLLLVVGVTLEALLILRERGLADPLIPVDLLRIPIFSLSLCNSICAFGAHMAALVALPFDLQHRLGFSPVQTGLMMTPWPLAVAAAAPVAGWLADRFPPALLGGIGMAVMTTGIVLLAAVSTSLGVPVFMACMALAGLGFGLFQSPNNRILLGSSPRSRAGAAGGMQGTARLLGQSLGAVSVAVCFHLSKSQPTLTALAVAAVAASLATVISFTRLGVAAPVQGEAAEG